MKRRNRNALLIWSLLGVGTFLVCAFLLPTYNSAGNYSVYYWTGIISFMAVLFPWLLMLFVPVYRSVFAGITAADTPVPSPEWIYNQLIEELGREPTFQEVAAVQQMLINERHQKMEMGLIAGAALFAAHEELKKH